MKFNLLFLTCANKEEAEKIEQALLNKKLVYCVKKTPVSSTFLWKGKIANSGEVLLVMDSVEENFEKVNAEIKKIHSYETFVLTSVPVTKTTKEVETWVKEELSNA